MNSLYDGIVNSSFLYSSYYTKDDFAFNIRSQDKDVIGNLDKFICFDSKDDVRSSVELTSSFYYVSDQEIIEQMKLINEYDDKVIIHGGTPEQHAYALRYKRDNLTVFKMITGKEFYLICADDRNDYIIVGDSEVLNFDALRIVREVYYRQSLKLGRIALHASAVMQGNNDCVLITGNKGKGKTTLLCDLITNMNYGFLDNDRVLLGIDNNRLFAYSLSTTVNIGYGTMKNHRDVFPYDDSKEDSDKKKYNRLEFIHLLNCNSNTKGEVTTIVLPELTTDVLDPATYECGIEEKTSALYKSLERINNSEHPDWLGISKISEKEYDDNIKAMIHFIMATIPIYRISFGYKKLDNTNAPKQFILDKK